MDMNLAVGIGAVMIVLMFILNFIGKIIEIKKSGDRQPPLDREMYKDYARKNELDCTELRLRGEMLKNNERFEKMFGEVFEIQRQMKSSTEKTFQDITLMLGRIEGKLDEHTKNNKG